MKIPIVFTFLIAAAAAGLGWHHQLRLVKVREGHARIVSTAAARGIFLGPNQGIRITKHHRENRIVEIKVVIDDYVALRQEIDAKGEASIQDKGLQQRSAEITNRLMLMDAAQLRSAFLEVHGSQKIAVGTRRILCHFVTWILADKHPREFLAFLVESPELFQDPPEFGIDVGSPLARLAKDDLAGAIKWLRTNGKLFPHLVSDNTKQGVIVAAARQDPEMAFQLIGKLGFKNPDSAVENISWVAKDSGQRTATLAAFRSYLSTITDAKVRGRTAYTGIEHLTRSATEEGFETGSKWLAEAGFSPEESGYVAEGVHWNWVKPDEISQWIEWLGDMVPDGNGKESIRLMVQTWTQKDHQAAGKWLANSPDGPAKTSAVRTFAETVSKYDPEVAAQWANTLPPGKDRDQTLKNIHRNWPEENLAGKAAFAKEHGIKSTGSD